MQGVVHLRAFERGEGHRGPPADGRLVLQGGEHGGQSRRVADGPEGGHGCLSAERIGVAAEAVGQPGQGADHDRVPPFPAGPGGHLDHPRVRIVEGRCAVDTGPAGGELAGSPANLGRRVGQGRRHLVVGERAEALQRAERGGPHGRGGVVDRRHGPRWRRRCGRPGRPAGAVR